MDNKNSDEITSVCLETHTILQFVYYLQSEIMQRRITVKELSDLVGEEEDWMIKLLTFKNNDIEIRRIAGIAYRLGDKLSLKAVSYSVPEMEEK